MVYRLQATIDDILRLIQNETSPLVINSGLTVVLKLASSVNDAVSNSRILLLAKKVICFTVICVVSDLTLKMIDFIEAIKLISFLLHIAGEKDGRKGEV